MISEYGLDALDSFWQGIACRCRRCQREIVRADALRITKWALAGMPAKITAIGGGAGSPVARQAIDHGFWMTAGR